MRKILLALAAFVVTVGLTVAAPAVFVKYDDEKKELVVKEGKKGNETEKTYKITDKTKFKDGDKELSKEDAMKKLTDKEKMLKRLDVTAEDGSVTELKFVAKKGKTN